MSTQNYVVKNDQFTPIGKRGNMLKSREIIRIQDNGENTLNPGKYVRFHTGARYDLISYNALIAFFNKIVMPVPDDTWYVPEIGPRLYYSVGNSKIQLAGEKLDLNNPISFGKPAVITCMLAGLCKDYCYADGINAQYWLTLKYQCHNYYMIYQNLGDVEELTRLFDEMIKASQTELLRFGDFGDIIHVNELRAIVEASRLNPDTIIYGYTKSTGIVLNYLEAGGKFTDNFRLNISSTDNLESQINATKLVQKYGLATCYILETGSDVKDWYKAGLPFNDGELEAIKGERDFAIALHGTFRKADQRNWYNADLVGRVLTDLGIETC